MNDQNISIKEALGFPEGTPIPRIVGKLTHLFDRKSGEGKHGPYTSQSGVISDGENKILFTVWNKPEFPQDYKGQTIIFRAGTGKKPTMTLKSDFKDATKRTLNVTASCIVLTESEDTDDIPYDDAPKSIASIAGSMMTEGLPKNPPQANVATKKAIPTHNESVDALMRSQKRACGAEDGVQVVKHRLMQMANFRALCDASVEYLYGEGASDEMKKDVSSCFFIQGMREGLEKQLPNNKPLSKKEDVEASENLEEKEDVQF